MKLTKGQPGCTRPDCPTPDRYHWHQGIEEPMRGTEGNVVPDYEEDIRTGESLVAAMITLVGIIGTLIVALDIWNNADSVITKLTFTAAYALVIAAVAQIRVWHRRWLRGRR